MSDNVSVPEATVLLSYDVAGEARSLAVRVCHLVFGQGDGHDRSTPPYILRPGVVWVGQSVLLLPGPLADELAAGLRGLGARVATARVRVAPADLSAFARGRSATGSGAGSAPQNTCDGKVMERL